MLEKIESSKRKPIFALFFNGTHEMKANMSQLASRYDSVEFTEIDCLLERDFCSKYFCGELPSVRLIRGGDPAYWRSPLGEWSEFLEVEMTPAAVEQDVIPDGPRNETHFHLLLRPQSRKALQMFIAAADFYKVLGCSFTYSLKGSEVPVLTAIMGRGFNVSTRVRPLEIEPFIEHTRFAASHVFTPLEFIAFSELNPMILFVRNGNEPNPILPLLTNMDMGLRFGEMLRADCEDTFPMPVPQFIGFNRALNCIVYTDNVSDVVFYRNVLRGQNCSGHLSRTRANSQSPLRSALLVITSGGAFFAVAYFGFVRTRRQCVSSQAPKLKQL